jgi:hypothetical protein
MGRHLIKVLLEEGLDIAETAVEVAVGGHLQT